MTGIVKIFHNGDGKGKGYGFIRPDGAARDVFVHIRNCTVNPRELSAGDRVEFDIEEGGERGARATNVRCTQRAPQESFTPATRE